MGCGCKNKNKQSKIRQQIQRVKSVNSQSTPGGIPVKDYLKQLKETKK